MSDDELPGIKMREAADNQAPEDPDPEELLTELEVEDLSDLTQAELETIFGALEKERGLRGITQNIEGDEASVARRRQAVQTIVRGRQEQVLEEQLQQLEEIDDDTQLLKQVAQQLSTVSNEIQTTNQILADVIESNNRGPTLTVKDFGQVSFNQSNTARDVIDDTDKSTSVIIIKANANNDGDLFIGTEDIEVGEGYRLEAGEKEKFPIDVLIDKFQITAQEVNDDYSYLAMGLRPT